MQKDIDYILIHAPLLKAKQIAKQLGLPRKEVNAFLHKHKDRYEQDAAFRWSLIAVEERQVRLPGGWVTADTFEGQLRLAGPVLKGRCGAVVIVFLPGSKPMIDCAARLLALANQLVHNGRRVTLDFTSEESTRTYLDRAGFFDHLHSAVEVLPDRPAHSAAQRYKGNSEALVEFGAVDPKVVNDAMIEELTSKFVQQSSAKYRIAAYTVFSELINNVVDHSETPLTGFAGLQKYRGRRRHIQTVVSDSGVGIAHTLRPALQAYYPALYEQFGRRSLQSDMGLVEAALREGGISRFGGARGLGFKSSREQAAVKFDAQLCVRQEHFSLNFQYRDSELVNIHKQANLSNLLGTHICFDFYLD